MPSDRLEDAHPTLVDAWTKIRAEYEAANPGKHVTVTCTHRSADEQYELYKQGREIDSEGHVISILPSRIVTQIDGRTKKSNHNYLPSRALDFAVTIGGKITWLEKEYEPVGRLAEAHGLVWGGAWRSFKDRPHVELKGDV